MAKAQGSVPDKDLKKLLQQLFDAVQLVAQTTKDTTRVNRDLLKVMALLESGFASSKSDAQDLMEQVIGGLQITDELTIKWAKQRKIAKEDLEQLLGKFRKLEELDEDTISNSKDYIELLQIRHDLIEGEVDLSKKLLNSQNEILKVIKNSKNAGIAVTDEFGNMNDLFSKILAKKVDFTGIFDDSQSSIGKVDELLSKIKNDISGMTANVSGQFTAVDLHFNPLSNQIDDEIKQVLDNIAIEKNARLDSLQEFFDKNSKLQTQLSRSMAASFSGLDVTINVDTGEIETATGILKQGTSEFEAMSNQLDEIAKSNGIIEKLGTNFKEVVSLVGIGTTRTEEQTQKLQELLKPMGLVSNELTNQFVSHIVNLDKLSATVQKQNQLYKAVSQTTSKLQSAESIVLKIGTGFDYINSILPTGISEFLGLSKISSALIDSHKRGVQDFTKNIEEGGDQVSAMNSYFKSFAPAIKLALNPMMLMVVGATLLFKFVENITEKYKELASEMKVSLGQAKEFFQVQLDTLTSQKNQFATMEDLQQIQSAMIGSSGKVLDLTNKDAKELSINLVEVGKYFGYGNEQAVQLHKTFERLGASDKLSLQLQRNVGKMAEMAGLSPQIVGQDLIDSAEEVATYFAGMPEQAARAVIQVRRMGMSLKQAGAIAQKMLELESFMTDMYELQAMSAGGIDFSSAFDKGLMGDIEGMTKAIMEQVGTTAEYNKMDFLTRTKIAKTLGMSNEDLAKSVMLHEKMNGLNSKDTAYLNANVDRMGDISAMSQEDIRNKMQSLQSTDRMGVAWDKIKGVLVDSLLPLVESFSDIMDAISPILDIVIFGFKAIGQVIKLLGPLINGIVAPFKWLGEGLSYITGLVDDFSDNLSGIQPIIDVIGKGLYFIGAGIGILFAPSIFKSVLSGFGSILKFIPFVGSMFGSVGKGAKDSLTDATSSISTMASNVSATMSSMSTSIVTAMNGVADSIKETFSKLNTNASLVTSTSAKVTSDVATDIEKSAMKASKATAKMSKDAQVSVAATQAVIKKSSGGALSFMSADTAKSTFGTIGSIASKTFAIMAVRSASSFFTMRKEGEEQAGAMSENMGGMMDMAFMGAGTLLTGYLQEGIEKVFTKKIETKIEDRLKDPIKKAAKAFGSLESPAVSSFGKIGEKGKSIFGKIAEFAKKILPGSTTSLTGTFDNLASSASKSLPKLETIQEVTETVKNKSKEIIEKTSSSGPDKVPDVQKPIQSAGKKAGSGFNSFTNIMKSVWNGLKTVLTDIVKFVSTAMKELSSGIGTSIKNILKGIGDGLSSFKSSALTGAAALVVLSGALWIASKAIQNFAAVKWEDLAKAGVALAGLAAVGMLLGGASIEMIIGAAGIAILGASLIPMAYALNMFNEVDWASIGKATVALITFGILGSAMSVLAVNLIFGAAGIAVFGAALIPMAYALNMFNDVEWSSLAKAGVALLGLSVVGTILGAASPLILAGSSAMVIASVGIAVFAGSIQFLGSSIANLTFDNLKGLTSSLIDLTSISILSLFGIAGGIGAIANSLLAFGMISSIGSALSTIFGGGIVKDLEKLGNLADPLYIVNNVLKEIGGSIANLSESIAEVDFGKFDELAEIGKIGIGAEVQKKIDPRMRDVSTVQPNTQNVKISPFQTPVATIKNPSRESTAQDKAIIQPPSPVSVAQDKMINSNRIFGIAAEEKKRANQDNYSEQDMVPENSKTDQLLQQLVQLMTVLVAKDPSLVLDGVKVNAMLKKHNNGR